VAVATSAPVRLVTGYRYLGHSGRTAGGSHSSGGLSYSSIDGNTVAIQAGHRCARSSRLGLL